MVCPPPPSQMSGCATGSGSPSPKETGIFQILDSQKRMTEMRWRFCIGTEHVRFFISGILFNTFNIADKNVHAIDAKVIKILKPRHCSPDGRAPRSEG